MECANCVRSICDHVWTCKRACKMYFSLEVLMVGKCIIEVIEEGFIPRRAA